MNELINDSRLPENVFYSIFGGRDRVNTFVQQAGDNVVFFYPQFYFADGDISSAELLYWPDNDRYAKKLEAMLQVKDVILNPDYLELYNNRLEVVADVTPIGRDKFDKLPDDAHIGYVRNGHFYSIVHKRDVIFVTDKNMGGTR